MARNSVWLEQGEEGQEGAGGSGGAADGVGLAAGRDLGWVSISTAPQSHLGAQDRRAGDGGGGECGSCPAGPPGGGRGWILGVLLAVEPLGWPSGPCLVGGGIIAVKGVPLWNRQLKAQQTPLWRLARLL